jgi:hypothetical protein
MARDMGVGLYGCIGCVLSTDDQESPIGKPSGVVLVVGVQGGRARWVCKVYGCIEFLFVCVA